MSSSRAAKRLSTTLTTLIGLITISVSALVTSYSSPLYAAKADHDEQLDAAELKNFLQHNLGKDTALKDKFDAEVWLLGMRARMAAYQISDKESYTILTTVYQEAQNSNLKPDIVLALIAAESSFNRFAVSSAGAQGLMQIMPFWKNEIGRADDNLTDIATNIRYGCKILQFYLQKENGNLALALARYNGSVGQTRYSEKVLTIWANHWRSGRL